MTRLKQFMRGEGLGKGLTEGSSYGILVFVTCDLDSLLYQTVYIDFDVPIKKTGLMFIER